MAGEWEQYLADETLNSEAFALDENEPRFPYEWGEIDPLAQRLRSERLSERFDFDNWIGWTYVAWRRLSKIHRYQARLERTLLGGMRGWAGRGAPLRIECSTRSWA
jgi:hypothetical protein